MQLIDTTLREGEQAPGVCFDLLLKKKIAQGLVATGVAEIELGIAVAGDSDLIEFGHWFQALYPEQSFSLWSRCCREDIYFARSLNPSVLALSVPVSDLHLHDKLAKDRNWARERLRGAIRFAFFLGASKVAVGFEDATRADNDFIREMAVIAREEGAFRLRLADTVGVATPKVMGQKIDTVAGLGLEIGVHCHNDFGMATANTIASLEHGAKWADVTVLGLGERAGNSRLEEVASFLKLQKGGSSYDLLAMCRLSRFLAQKIGRQIPVARPMLGDDIFTCETGLHLQGLMANPQTYEPYDPSCVGGKRRLLVGAKAGRHAVGKTVQRLGFAEPDPTDLAKLTRQVRALSHEKKRPLVDHEVVGLAVACLGHS